MPRGPRLDSPGALHHVMIRGIERCPIFGDDTDRYDLLHRIEALAETDAFSVYAWAFMPNHVHLLLRSGSLSLSRSMRSLLTGYAVRFNRRHERSGHLFQNRFKSIICEEQAYFLELVRYIHLNPLRGGILRTLEELDRYPFTGHSSLIGSCRRRWQCADEVLEHFSNESRIAVEGYRDFVGLGVALGRRPELGGGGLVRSAGGWTAVSELRKGREVFVADERVLGGSQFVSRLLKEAARTSDPRAERRRSTTLEDLIPRVCESAGIDQELLLNRSRLADVCRAREGLAFLWIECLGRSGRELALALGIRPGSAYKAAKRGQVSERQWRELLGSVLL